MHVIARCVKIGGPRRQKDLTATDRKSNGKWAHKVLSVGLYSKGGIFTAKKKTVTDDSAKQELNTRPKPHNKYQR